MPLTDAKCRTTNCREKSYKLADGGGLYLLITPNGGRYWRLDYRFLSKRKTLALGVYPFTSLAEARQRRTVAKKLLENGTDPARQRKIEKRQATMSSQQTFRAVADEYVEKLGKEGRAPVTLEKKRWLLDLLDREIGNLPISEITAPDVLSALKRIEARGRYETAGRARALVGAVSRYGVATGRSHTDPTPALRGALITPQVTHRATIIVPEEIGALMRAIDGYRGVPQVEAALKLLPLFFCRPGELRGAEWNEFDREAAIWTVSAGRTKTRRPHRVPLSRQALKILQELHQKTGSSPFLFPSVRSWHRHISENTLNAALRRIGYDQQDMTAHGFRAMAATRLNEMMRWHPDVIERALGHQEPNAVRRAYTSGVEYWPERVDMMQVWADYLDNLRGSKKEGGAAILAR